MTWAIVLIFLLVYFGMMLGNFPGLALDRTGIALLGSIAIMFVSGFAWSEYVAAVDIPTIAILFSFMIISAQFYYSGFYRFITEKMHRWRFTPPYLLLVVILITGLLSSVLINDIVCLAMTPLIIQTCRKKSLNALPFLLGVATSSNIGSALTLIGNPQNMLIGQSLQLSFSSYLFHSFFPCILGLFIAWIVIVLQTRKNWIHEQEELKIEIVPYDRWQSLKGVLAILFLLVVFLFFDLPRGQISLMVAGFLLLSRKMTTKTMLSFIDWQLLVLFVGLFVVNQSFVKTEILEKGLKDIGITLSDLASPVNLFILVAILSNIVSNVPAVMLLLPFANTHLDGSVLALSSTLAGNFLIIGSIANIIVISQASNLGYKISWRNHAVVGIPITVLTLLLTAAWLSIFF